MKPFLPSRFSVANFSMMRFMLAGVSIFALEVSSQSADDADFTDYFWLNLRQSAQSADKTEADSSRTPEFFRLNCGERGANFPDDFHFSQRARGGGLVQVGLDEFRVERDGAIGINHRLVVETKLADHHRQIRPAEFVAGIQFQSLLDAQ